MSKKPKVLFLTYDGMTDPLGQSQVLSYLKILSKEFSFDVLSFDKPEIYAQKEQLVHDFIKGYDIRWIPMMYTKSPPILSTVMDLQAGWKKIKQLGKETHYDIIHSRGCIIGSLALKSQKYFNAKMVFDMRGWWADEKRDSGNWANPLYKPVYSYFKALETKLFKRSDHAISLTRVGYEEIGKLDLKPLDEVSIIPTCVDFKIFKPFDIAIRQQVREQLDIALDSKVILYSGSLGGNYNMAVIFDLYKAMSRRYNDVKILLLTRTERSYIEEQADKAGVSMNDIRITASDFADVHKYLMAGDCGIVNYLRTYSTIGRSPTKLGEYWACGLPVVSQSNIGDIDYLVNKYEGSGVLIDELTDAGYDKAVQDLAELNVDKEKLRSQSVDYYDIEQGARIYTSIYNKILN